MYWNGPTQSYISYQVPVSPRARAHTRKTHAIAVFSHGSEWPSEIDSFFEILCIHISFFIDFFFLIDFDHDTAINVTPKEKHLTCAALFRRLEMLFKPFYFVHLFCCHFEMPYHQRMNPSNRCSQRIKLQNNLRFIFVQLIRLVVFDAWGARWKFFIYLNKLTFVQHNVQAFKRPIEHDYCANDVRIELLRLIWMVACLWVCIYERMAFDGAANQLIKLNCSFDDKMRMKPRIEEQSVGLRGWRMPREWWKCEQLWPISTDKLMILSDYFFQRVWLLDFTICMQFSFCEEWNLMESFFFFGFLFLDFFFLHFF